MQMFQQFGVEVNSSAKLSLKCSNKCLLIASSAGIVYKQEHRLELTWRVRADNEPDYSHAYSRMETAGTRRRIGAGISRARPWFHIIITSARRRDDRIRQGSRLRELRQ